MKREERRGKREERREKREERREKREERRGKRFIGNAILFSRFALPGTDMKQRKKY